MVKTKAKAAAEWKLGDPISEVQDQARRKYSPCFREDERGEYERQLYLARVKRAHDSTEEELHLDARMATAFAAVNPDEADRARRQFSPEVQEDEREEYEERIWVVRTGMGHVFTVEQIHFEAKIHVRNMRDIRYQRSLGAMKVIEAQREKTSTHTQKMRDARAESLASKRAANRERAEQSLEWARLRFTTAAADNSIDFLKTKAAEHLGITKRSLNNWLKK